jgi:hypothetical protein
MYQKWATTPHKKPHQKTLLSRTDLLGDGLDVGGAGLLDVGVAQDAAQLAQQPVVVDIWLLQT